MLQTVRLGTERMMGAEADRNCMMSSSNNDGM